MTREIIFRGFHKEENGKETIYIDGQPIKGKWVYGWLFQIKYATKKYFIRAFSNKDDEYIDYVVIPETIGQCVGLPDKNGKLIFENDVVRYDSGFGGYETSKIFYDEYRLSLNFKTDFGYNYSGIWELRNKKNIEIIRTKFDKEVKDNEYQ